MLPFPTDPGQLFRTALVACSGVHQRCAAVSPRATFNVAARDVHGPTTGGLAYAIGRGTTCRDSGAATVELHPTEFLADGVFGDLGPVAVDLDPDGPRASGEIVPLDPERAPARCAEAANPVNATCLSALFTSDPGAFHAMCLEWFFPARVVLRIPVRATTSYALTSAGTLDLVGEEVTGFPPHGAAYRLSGPVKFEAPEQTLLAADWPMTLSYTPGAAPFTRT